MNNMCRIFLLVMMNICLYSLDKTNNMILPNQYRSLFLVTITKYGEGLGVSSEDNIDSTTILKYNHDTIQICDETLKVMLIIYSNNGGISNQCNMTCKYFRNSPLTIISKSIFIYINYLEKLLDSMDLHNNIKTVNFQLENCFILKQVFYEEILLDTDLNQDEDVFIKLEPLLHWIYVITIVNHMGPDLAYQWVKNDFEQTEFCLPYTLTHTEKEDHYYLSTVKENVFKL